MPTPVMTYSQVFLLLDTPHLTEQGFYKNALKVSSSTNHSLINVKSKYMGYSYWDKAVS